MFNRDQATPQEEFNKKLHKREKKLRERVLEVQEKQARAQERLHRAEARLHKRLARVQRLEDRLAAIQQHQTEPLPEPNPPSNNDTADVGARFIAPSTPSTPSQSAPISEPDRPAIDATPEPNVGAHFIASPASSAPTTTLEPETIESEQTPIIHTEPLPTATPAPQEAQPEPQPQLEMQSQNAPTPEQAQPAAITMEKTEEPPVAITLPPWAQQEATIPEPVGARFIAPSTPSLTNINETPSPPVDLDEEAGYGPSLDELFQSNEHAYEPQAPAVQASTIAIDPPSNPSNSLTPTLSIASPTPTPPMPSTPTQITEAQNVTTSGPSTETISTIAERSDTSDINDASDARAVAIATEQNTRTAASRALAIEERAQQIEATSQTEAEQEHSASSMSSASSVSSENSEHNLVSPELASTAKALSISQLDEEEEEVEMRASSMVSDAAAAAAAEAEAAAEASSARTREARRMAEDAELMLHQVRMAIERGVLRGEDAEAALHFTEREATRAHAVLIDAEAAEAEAVRTAMNAEAEAEVAEGMSIAIEKRNAYDERMRIYDEATPVDGVLLDELPDDDETVEIPIIQPRENP